METRNMKNRPFYIKAVLFRLEPTPALLTASRYLISKNLRLGIIGRSDANTIRQDLRNCGFVNEAKMAVIISRPEIIQGKADADLIHLAAQKMNVAADNILFISPHAAELKTAKRAGAITAWIRTGEGAAHKAPNGDFEIENIAEIKDIVRMGIPLPAGKLPNKLLRDFLNQLIFDDPSVLINPGVGEDIKLPLPPIPSGNTPYW